jgi:hypothetical protein
LSRSGKLLLAVAVAGALFGIASAVQASIPDSGGVAHGCYYVPPKLGGTQQLPGDLRLIDTDKGQHCNSDESSVDLATTQFVTQHQTEYMGRDNLSLTAGPWRIQWDCAGLVATHATVFSSPYTNTTAPIALHAENNLEMETSGFPGKTAIVTFTLSSAMVVHTQVTCVDPRVFGETYPVTAPAPGSVKPTLTVQPGP